MADNLSSLHLLALGWLLATWSSGGRSLSVRGNPADDYSPKAVTQAPLLAARGASAAARPGRKRVSS